MTSPPPRFVVAGEALMDVFVAGATDDGVRLDARVGGSPFNIAVGLARLGQPVAFLGGLSQDLFGERLLRRLRQEGVDTACVQRLPQPTTLSVVGVDQHGVPHYAFHGHGAADRQLADAPLPDSAEVLQVGSYALVVPPAGPRLQAMVRREHARRLIALDPNVRLTVEPDVARWRDTLEAMLPFTHLLKISDEDATALYPGTPADTLAGHWLAQGVSLVVMTRGAKGARAWNAAGHAQAAGVPVMLVDTVGAGDAFQAALLAWLAEHGRLDAVALRGLDRAPLEQALGFAAGAAAITCSRRGADAPRRHELPT